MSFQKNKLPNPVLTRDQASAAYALVIKKVAEEIWQRSGGRDEWKKKRFIYDDSKQS
ncbi:MAG TPA: hypothetical protein VFB72_18690 [Verrucomicrobiae bacterium]|nr:hypothetical protein [Verrucomicrobiae bacterium]